MSDQPAVPPRSPAPRPKGQVAVPFLLIVAGALLIFPGVCSLAAIVILFGINPQGAFGDSSLVSLWAVCFAAAAAGILLICYAVRRNAGQPGA